MIKDISLINPIDFYNRNYINDAIDILLNVNNVRKVDISSFTYYKNKSDLTDKKIIIIDNEFIIKKSVGLGLIVGNKYTPFMILQHFKFKTNYKQAVNYVMSNLMGYNMNYIRVNTKYYKLVKKTDRYNIERNEIRLWEKSTIIDDNGKHYLSTIEHFDDFTIEPNNKEYRAIIGNNYNLYSKFSHEPIEFDIELANDFCEWTFILLKHIFGDQYDLGIRYLKVLYDNPKQILPILVLVSEKRGTGKTTFVNWLSILFGNNAVVVNPQDMATQFNGSYSDKNLIIIEESKFENIQTTEKLKNLATQKKILVNTKFIQHYSVPFYGKLIITSNDENKFSKVDSPEIRYWVRKIPNIERGKGNHSIEDDLVTEIPYFLHYLNSLENVNLKKSRMVFTPEEIKTEALERVKAESKPELQKNIEIYLDNFCEQNSELDKIYFTAIDLKDKFFQHNSRVSVSYINKILRDSMKLNKLPTSRQIPFQDSNIHGTKKVGRFYEYKNKFNGLL